MKSHEHHHSHAHDHEHDHAHDQQHHRGEKVHQQSVAPTFKPSAAEKTAVLVGSGLLMSSSAKRMLCALGLIGFLWLAVAWAVSFA